jgi:hypothetical protein
MDTDEPRTLRAGLFSGIFRAALCRFIFVIDLVWVLYPNPNGDI